MDYWVVIWCLLFCIINLILVFSLYLLKCKIEAKKWKRNYHMIESMARSYVEWYVKQNEDEILEKLPSMIDKVVKDYYNKEDDYDSRCK